MGPGPENWFSRIMAHTDDDDDDDDDDDEQEVGAPNLQSMSFSKSLFSKIF